MMIRIIKIIFFILLVYLTIISLIYITTYYFLSKLYRIIYIYCIVLYAMITYCIQFQWILIVLYWYCIVLSQYLKVLYWYCIVDENVIQLRPGSSNVSGLPNQPLDLPDLSLCVTVFTFLYVMCRHGQQPHTHCHFSFQINPILSLAFGTFCKHSSLSLSNFLYLRFLLL